MKFADEIMNNKKTRLEQKLKEHNALVNEEMLVIEKAINTYEKDDEDTKPYIDIQMIINTEEAKESLKEHKFYIDKVNQDIPYGITRVYLTEEAYKEATRNKNITNFYKETKPNNNNINTIKIKSIDKDDEEKVNMFDQILANIMGYSNITELQEAIKKAGGR